MPHHARLPLWQEKNAAQKLDALRAMMDDLYGYTLGAANQRLLDQLEQAQPADAKERDDIQRMRELIAEHPNILAQNCEIGHITGSALVIDPAGGQALLHFHRNLRRWMQFGGHLDFETDPAQAALREAREESGLADLAFFPDEAAPRPLDFDIHPIAARAGRPDHLHLDWRYLLMTRTPQAVQPPDDESQELRWIDLSDVDAAADLDLDASLLRLIRKAAAMM